MMEQGTVSICIHNVLAKNCPACKQTGTILYEIDTLKELISLNGQKIDAVYICLVGLLKQLESHDGR